MDALEILKEDHARVSRLFDQFRSLGESDDLRPLFSQIRSELEIHTHIEETVFYPTFNRYDDIKPMIDEAFGEHAEVKSLLQEIGRIRGPDSKLLRGKMDTLMTNVEHHVREEEDELFPKVREVMKGPERERLGRHLQAARDEKQAA